MRSSVRLRLGETAHCKIPVAKAQDWLLEVRSVQLDPGLHNLYAIPRAKANP